MRALERAGYGVLVDPELSTTRHYQRAEDERRAESFTRMWLDPRVKAVIGGTGSYAGASGTVVITGDEKAVRFTVRLK